jgi:hypothetical protein
LKLTDCLTAAAAAAAADAQELVTLLPDLSSLLFSLNPTILAQLTADTPGVAQKLVRQLWVEWGGGGGAQATYLLDNDNRVVTWSLYSIVYFAVMKCILVWRSAAECDLVCCFIPAQKLVEQCVGWQRACMNVHNPATLLTTSPHIS